MKAKALILKFHLYSALVTSAFLLALTLSGMLMMLEGNVLPSSFIAENHQLLPQGERMPVAAVVQELEQRYGETPTQLTVRGGRAPGRIQTGAGSDGLREPLQWSDPRQ